jgi:hypothetical protein
VSLLLCFCVSPSLPSLFRPSLSLPSSPFLSLPSLSLFLSFTHLIVTPCSFPLSTTLPLPSLSRTAEIDPDTLNRALTHLGNGQPARTLPPADAAALQPLNLITSKAMLFVANVSEEQAMVLAKGGDVKNVAMLRKLAGDAQVVPVSVQVCVCVCACVLVRFCMCSACVQKVHAVLSLAVLRLSTGGSRCAERRGGGEKGATVNHRHLRTRA